MHILDKLLSGPASLSIGEVMLYGADIQRMFSSGVSSSDQHQERNVESSNSNSQDNNAIIGPNLHAVQAMDDSMPWSRAQLADLYITASPKIRLFINGRACFAIWDTGAESTIVSKTMADNARLSISPDIMINMHGVSGTLKDKFECAENVSVAFDANFVYFTRVFVSKEVSGDLILIGRPLQRVLRSILEDAESGETILTIWHPDSGETRRITACERLTEKDVRCAALLKLYNKALN